MIKEFQEFIARGNVVDLAIGVVIGAAFGKVITAVVEQLLNPLIGALFGADLSNWFLAFGDTAYPTLEAARDAGALAFGFGVVLQVALEFVLVAFVLFLVVKAYNALRRRQEEAPATPAAPPKEQVLLEEIRDLMRAQADKA